MSYTLLRKTVARASKDYRCIWCGQAIPRAYRHVHEVSVYERELQDQRWHHECEEAWWRVQKAWGEYEFTPFDNLRGKPDHCDV